MENGFGGQVIYRQFVSSLVDLGANEQLICLVDITVIKRASGLKVMEIYESSQLQLWCYGD